MALRYMGVSGYAISGMAVSGLASVEQQAATLAVTLDDVTLSSTAQLLAQGTATPTLGAVTLSSAATIAWRTRLKATVRPRPGRVYQNAHINLPCYFRDEDGTLTDPDAVVFKLYSPTGATTTYTFGTDSEFEKRATGHYNLDFQVGQYAGRWHYVWIGTYGSDRTVSNEGSFVVQTSPFYEQSGSTAYRRYN